MQVCLSNFYLVHIASNSMFLFTIKAEIDKGERALILINKISGGFSIFSLPVEGFDVVEIYYYKVNKQGRGMTRQKRIIINITRAQRQASEGFEVVPTSPNKRITFANFSDSVVKCLGKVSIFFRR